MEQQLGDLFLQTVSTLNNAQTHYLAFDFHKECRKLDWSRLEALLVRIRSLPRWSSVSGRGSASH